MMIPESLPYSSLTINLIDCYNLFVSDPQSLHAMSGDEHNSVLEEKIKARAKRVFDLVDKNHDGQVTVDELVNVCMRNPDVYNMVVSTTKATAGGKRKS